MDIIGIILIIISLTGILLITGRLIASIFRALLKNSNSDAGGRDRKRVSTDGFNSIHNKEDSL